LWESHFIGGTNCFAPIPTYSGTAVAVTFWRGKSVCEIISIFVRLAVERKERVALNLILRFRYHAWNRTENSKFHLGLKTDTSTIHISMLQ
jgi:hypothetical protein